MKRATRMAEHQHQNGDDDVGDIEHDFVEQICHSAGRGWLAIVTMTRKRWITVNQLGQNARQGLTSRLPCLRKASMPVSRRDCSEFQHVEQLITRCAPGGEQPATNTAAGPQQLRYKTCQLRPRKKSGKRPNTSSCLLHDTVPHHR